MPESLSTVLEAVDEAFGIYDSDDRLVAFNNNYGVLRSAIGGDVALGVPWDDLVTASVRAGAIEEAIGREDLWLMQRRRDRGDYSVVRQIPGGRSFQVNERRMRHGGIVVVWTDVTDLVGIDLARHRPTDNQVAARGWTALSYDPHELMAEARRWRELAAQAPDVRRELYLGRADKCEMMAIQSVSIPPVVE